MKSYLQFTLEGRDWWKPFLPYWIIVAAIQVVTQTLSRAQWALENAGLYALFTFLLALATAFVGWIFTIVILRIVARKVSYGGDTFEFNGKVGEFIGLNVGGILLTIITATIFAPWYIRRVMAYLASHTTWRGGPLDFKGKGGRLFLFFLVGVWAPVIVVMVIAAVTVGLDVLSGTATEPSAVTALLYTFIVLYTLTMFSYLLYKWYVNMDWKDVHVRWDTHFWPSFGMILGQVLLSAITITIYWPAACKRLYTYLAGKTVFERNNAPFAHAGFDGQKGFGLLWGQALLSIITLGIYIPWATSRIGKWLINATYVETTGN